MHVTLHPKALSVAVAIADTGSATEAARVLSISQPGVSYHLRGLERALGTTLFHRGAAGLVVTPEGHVLVEGARRVLADLERVASDVRAAAAGRGQTVRISSACFTNYHWLPSVLRAFREEMGEVRVELDVDPHRRTLEALDRGALDIVLTTVPPRGGAFTAHDLFDDEIVAVMRPEHPLSGRPYLEAADFTDQTVVVFDRQQSDLFNRTLAPAGVTPREVTDVPVTEALLELVRAGVAISAMATWVLRPDLDAGRLVGLRIGADGLKRTWCAVLSARRPPSPVVARFVEILRESCREQGGILHC
jgi:LysR family transcriptional regulator for metE and metH